MEKKLILITGAAGTYGRILRTQWQTRYRLRLADVNDVDVPLASVSKADWGVGSNGLVVADGAAIPLGAHEHFVTLDSSSYESMLAACQGVDTVVHLAADPRPNAPFHTSLLPINVEGVFNCFEAAATANCRRVIFASSVHAMLGYKGDGHSWGEAWAENDRAPNPQNIYGATKAWGEALCRTFSNSRDISCIAVRVRRFTTGQPPLTPAPRSLALRAQFTSPREDTAAAIAENLARCVEAPPDVKFDLLNWVELADPDLVVTGAAARL